MCPTVKSLTLLLSHEIPLLLPKNLSEKISEKNFKSHHYILLNIINCIIKLGNYLFHASQSFQTALDLWPASVYSVHLLSPTLIAGSYSPWTRVHP